MSIELKKEVIDMCNLSSSIENRGIEKGKMEILQQLVKDKLLSIADAAKQVNKTEEEFLSWNTSPAVH